MSFRRPRSALPAALAAFCLLLAAAGPGAAQSRNSAYLVGGIAVDATAETATEAREAAIAEGQGRALVALYNRLVVPADIRRLPLLLPEQVQNLVQGFSVANERSATGRYLADFTVAFKPAAVRGLFQQYRVRFADAVSRPILVFPVFGEGAGAVLWQEPNPWRGAWTNATGRGGLIPIEVPLGDLSDMTAVTAEQALALDAARLRAVADRYGETDLLVAHARLDGDPAAGGAALRVDSQRLRGGRLSAGPSGSYQQAEGETLDGLLSRAVEATVARIEAGWRQANALDYSQQSRIEVLVPFADIADWAEVRRRLAETPTVLGSSVTLMKRNRAEVALTVVGSIEQLAGVLAQQDLTLARRQAAVDVSTSGGGAFGLRTEPQWQLSLRGGGGASPAPPPASRVRTLGATPEGVPPEEDASVERLDAESIAE